MDLNIVNWSEINAFLKTLKEKYPHPLLASFVDYKVRDYLIHNHYYISITLNQMTSEEKDLVKNKDGVYNRVLLGNTLMNYLILKCDELSINIGKGVVKTVQDVTNLPQINKMDPEIVENIVWVNEGLKIRTLTTSKELLDEGRRMKNCLGQKDLNLSKYDYFSLTKDDKEFISFKVSKKFKLLEEARYKANRIVSDNDKKILKEFIREYYKKETTEDGFIYLKIANLAVVLFSFFWVSIGFVGLVFYIANCLGFDNIVYFSILDYSYEILLVGVVLFLTALLFESRDEVIKIKVKNNKLLGKFLEWVND